jgi:hypothetical protein
MTDDVAALIGQLEGGHLDDLHTRLRNQAASALRALALENERLKDTLELKLGEAFAEHVALEAHMSELETERDSLKIAENHHHEEFARIEAERDAFRALALPFEKTSEDESKT